MADQQRQSYNYALALADLALQLEQEVITAGETRIAFDGQPIKESQADQVKYTYTVDVPQDDNIPVEMKYQVSFAKFGIQDNEVGYVENIVLLVGDAVFATFTHVSTPETFAAVEKNYEFYLKAKDNPELLKPKPEIFVPEKKIVIAS